VIDVSLSDIFKPITISIMPQVFNPIFLQMQIIQADVVRGALITSHPIEMDSKNNLSSTTISDNRVVLPREVQVDLICPDEATNRALMDSFSTHSLFTITTKNEVITNCAFAEAPYSNNAEMLNSTRYRLRFIEVVIVSPMTGKIQQQDTRNSSDVSTIRRGQVSTSTASPSVAQNATLALQAL
jgi:hypothetical protein